MLASFLLSALAAVPNPLQNEDQAVHDQLRALKAGIEAAFNEVGASAKREDLDAVLDFVTDDVVLTAMNGQCAVGKQGLVEYFERTMVGPGKTVVSVQHTFTPAGLSILYGGDTAVGYGSSAGTYELASGRSFDVDVLWTCTMVKQGDRWLIASFQFAPSIFDNPVLGKAVRSLYWIGGAAALGGLVLGFGASRLFGRGR